MDINKSIKLAIHFDTDNLPKKKMVWLRGKVEIRNNKYHGIRATKLRQCPFDLTTEEDLHRAIETVLEESGVTLVEKKDGEYKLLQIIN